MHAVREVLLLACLAFAAVAPAAPAADAGKTLRVAMSIAETSFDPAFASDAASDSIIANVFDAMLDYDYLARPVMPRAR
jgi:ABC-type oligopeptide transport system substrate-binding subunit